MSILVRKRDGVALVLALTILAVLVGMAAFFSVNVGTELQASRGTLYGVKAEALAEAGLVRTISKIRQDVRSMKYFGLDPEGDEEANSLVDQKYSTRAVYNEGIQDELVPGEDFDRTLKLDGTEAQPNENGYYVIVRDLNAQIDLNMYDFNNEDYELTTSWTNPELPLAFQLEQFPSISSELAEDIASAINVLPGNSGSKLRTKEQLRSVLRPLVASDQAFETIYEEIRDHITVKISKRIVSGGLVAKYYGLDTSGSVPVIRYDQFKGMTIERGNPYGTNRKYGEHTFRLNNAGDFYFNGTPLTDDPVVPVSEQTFSASNPFAVVWSGFIFIPNGTPVSLRAEFSGGIRMRIADQDLTGESYWDLGGGFFQNTFALPPGWQPILIEFHHPGGDPNFMMYWSGGYHHIDPALGDNNPADDPDVDVTTQETLLPMGSLGFKAGGIYEIVSTGVARNSQGDILAERSIRAEVKIWDLIHESSVQDFKQGTLTKVNYEDDCPIQPIGDFNASFIGNMNGDWNLEFELGGSHIRQYNTVYNALKLGYWENFEDPTAPGALANYPFQDPRAVSDPASDLNPWISPNSATSLRDISSVADYFANPLPLPDGDSELVVEDEDGVVSQNLYVNKPTVDTPTVSLVGPENSVWEPDEEYVYRNFYFRVQEYDGIGPVDQWGLDNMEDYDPDLSNPSINTNWDESRVAGLIDDSRPNGDVDPDTGDYDEDKNGDDRLNRRRDSMVGQLYFRQLVEQFDDFDHRVYLRQRDVRTTNPWRDFKYKPYSSPFQFGASGTFFPWYNETKWFVVQTRNSLSLLYCLPRLRRIDPADQIYAFYADAYSTTEGTFGFVASGNALIGQGTMTPYRAIDNVRIIPAHPLINSDIDIKDKGVFISRAYNASALAELTEWGWYVFNRHASETFQPEPFYQFGNQLEEQIPANGNYSRVAVEVNDIPIGGSISTTNADFNPSGSLDFLGSSTDVSYAVTLLMTCTNPGEVNLDQPIFEDITMTYLVEPDIFYYREE